MFNSIKPLTYLEARSNLSIYEKNMALSGLLSSLSKNRLTDEENFDGIGITLADTEDYVYAVIPCVGAKFIWKVSRSFATSNNYTYWEINKTDKYLKPTKKDISIAQKKLKKYLDIIYK